MICSVLFTTCLKEGRWLYGSPKPLYPLVFLGCSMGGFAKGYSPWKLKWWDPKDPLGPLGPTNPRKLLVLCIWVDFPFLPLRHIHIYNLPFSSLIQVETRLSVTIECLSESPFSFVPQWDPRSLRPHCSSFLIHDGSLFGQFLFLLEEPFLLFGFIFVK